MQKFLRIMVSLLGFLGLINLASAQVTDMGGYATEIAGQGSTLVGYGLTAAVGGLAVFALIIGIRVVSKSFKAATR